MGPVAEVLLKPGDGRENVFSRMLFFFLPNCQLLLKLYSSIEQTKLGVTLNFVSQPGNPPAHLVGYLIFREDLLSSE